jgi:ABC-2 type transport system ATP-binding protein
VYCLLLAVSPVVLQAGHDFIDEGGTRMSVTVEVKNYTKTIKGQTVLSNVTLQLESGVCYGLYGHNGCGKSMLMRAIAGLICPTEGCVTAFGKDLNNSNSFPDSLGLIIENVGFWPYFTGLENLKLLASIKGEIGEPEIRDAITRVGLDPDDRRVYHKYSLGMKQRLAIAQAIMEKPNLILLDEPTNALDEDGVSLIRKVVQEEAERGATILIASHNREDLTTLCSQFFKMNAGKLQIVEGVA